MSRLLTTLLCAACVGALAPSLAAAASPLDEYQRTGTISPCKYSGGQLGGDVPNDVAQYAPDYQAALERARRERAGCGGSGGAGGSGGGPGSGGPPVDSKGRPLPPGSSLAKAPAPPRVRRGSPTGGALGVPAGARRASGGIATTPAPVLALAVLAALLALLLALGVLARRLGWRARWAAPARHALAEAALRLGTAAGGLADWARSARA